MFTNKEEFKQQYCQRMIEKYGRSIQYSRCSERYLVLGEMVKDYASNNWMETKNKIDEKQQKQLYYFSMEFLIGRLLTNNLMNLGIYNIVKEGLSELGYDINEKTINYYILYYKLSSLKYLKYEYFRKTIFDCMNLIGKD